MKQLAFFSPHVISTNQYYESGEVRMWWAGTSFCALLPTGQFGELSASKQGWVELILSCQVELPSVNLFLEAKWFCGKKQSMQLFIRTLLTGRREHSATTLHLKCWLNNYWQGTCLITRSIIARTSDFQSFINLRTG
ncbi:hypothetical protein AVEN_228010-1 [Araneus ventricosus]|uniref:Uncharacterized protein n=1 Tax=Araneus ventricosus TaxID=182803 RepID=A0A4Y2SNL9_ARAVE|nr:hypothetical protein AVEN_228010-1 [Araneus ventricosus]